MAAVLKTAVPKGTWGFKSLTLRNASVRWDPREGFNSAAPHTGTRPVFVPPAHEICP